MGKIITEYSVDTFREPDKAYTATFYFTDDDGVVDEFDIPVEFPYSAIYNENENEEYCWIEIERPVGMCDFTEDDVLLPTFDVTYTDEETGQVFNCTFREFAYKLALTLKEKGYK